MGKTSHNNTMELHRQASLLRDVLRDEAHYDYRRVNDSGEAIGRIIGVGMQILGGVGFYTGVWFAIYTSGAFMLTSMLLAALGLCVVILGMVATAGGFHEYTTQWGVWLGVGTNTTTTQATMKKNIYKSIHEPHRNTTYRVGMLYDVMRHWDATDLRVGRRILVDFDQLVVHAERLASQRYDGNPPDVHEEFLFDERCIQFLHDARQSVQSGQYCPRSDHRL